jgi:hypothetical protein
MKQQLQAEQGRTPMLGKTNQESQLSGVQVPTLPVTPPPLRARVEPVSENTVDQEILLQQIDPEVVLQGIVWSEIIGPPRCRRRSLR